MNIIINTINKYINKDIKHKKNKKMKRTQQQNKTSKQTHKKQTQR